MSKRFIDSEIFKSKFLKGLTPEAKLFYIYLFCECDYCGIWKVEMDIAIVRLGIKLNEEELLKSLKGKVVPFDDGAKWFIPKFIKFQYGVLSLESKLHKRVIDSLNKNNLSKYLIDNQDKSCHPDVTVTSPRSHPDVRVKVKGKEKEKEKGKEKKKKKGQHIDNQAEAQNTAKLADLSDFKGDAVPTYKQSTKKAANQSKTAKKQPSASGLIMGQYQAFMAAYNEFYTSNVGLPINITAADGKALKSIIQYLNKMPSVIEGKKTAVDLWQFILDNWNRLDTRQQNQKQLRQISSRLPNIVEQIKNSYGNGKGNSKANQQRVADLAAALRTAIQTGE